MKVIIAGGRTFNDYNLLYQKCDKALTMQKEVEIVSGTANGTDKLGEKYANEKGFTIKQFPANWDSHGKSAGYIRNEEMAKYADAVYRVEPKHGGAKGTTYRAKIHNDDDVEKMFQSISPKPSRSCLILKKKL
jgi:hypothetical protein